MVTSSKYKIYFWAACWFAQFLLFYGLSTIDAAVDVFRTIFLWKYALTSGLFSSIPFSIGDIIYVLIFSFGFLTIYKLFTQNNRTRYLIRLLMVGNFLFLWYHFIWGMLYYQKPITEQLPSAKYSSDELKALITFYIKKTNQTRAGLPENEMGVFTIYHLEALKKEINTIGKNQASRCFKLPKEFKENMKPSIFSQPLSFLGILGYYNPFSGEAQYNREIPHSHLPFTWLHETAHQIGFAREQEASFIGFLMSMQSKKPEIQYSSYLYTCKVLLNTLPDNDPFMKKAKTLFSHQVKRDLSHEKIFLQKHQGFLADVFHQLNDWFLQYNNQEGVITYSYYAELILRYHKAQKKNHILRCDSKNTNDEKKFIALRANAH